MTGQSPSQTIGPFFHDALIDGKAYIMRNEQTQGQHVVIEGQVFDGEGSPITDAMVEIWQADANGFFNHPSDPNQAQADPNFKGFGRSATVENGRFFFQTVKPGAISGQAVPFINVRVFARGMLIHAMTRIYFADQGGNAADPVFTAVPAKRQATLLAHLQSGQGLPTYRFDIHMQGEKETVFFNP
jgi:protocatechuate 3,4-dioxygenase alpha subunit